MAKVLLVEDDSDIAFTIQTCLEMDLHVVETVDNGIEGAERLRFYKYDLAILDWNVPGITGIEICKRYRSSGGRIPIMILTGRSETVEKIAGLDSGADDYLTKPFDSRELMARVRALMRRPESAVNNLLRVGHLELDMVTHQVTCHGKEVELLPKEFALLQFLMRHPNQVFSQETLLDRVWSSEADATSDALRSTVKRLRKKIEVPGEPSLLSTLRGVGYSLSSG